MSSQRLNTGLKKAIVKKVLTYRFKIDLTQIIAEQKAIADAIYHQVYGVAEQSIMASLPKGWLPESERLMVQMGGPFNCFPLRFDGTHGFRHSQLSLLEKPAADVRRIAYKHIIGIAIVYDANDHICKLCNDTDNRLSKIQDLMYEAEQAVLRAADSVTTVGRLIEVWPELEPFCKELGGKPQPAKVNLPAIDRANLNQMLDLPVS